MQSTAKVVAGQFALVAVAVGLSTLSGCGEGKLLPGAGVISTEPRVGSQVVPAASEEKARQVVERAIRAMTDGHPERVEKTKVNRSTAKGQYNRRLPDGQFRFVDTDRLFQAVYPDRVRVDYEFKPYEFNPEGSRLTIGLRRPVGVWVRDSTAPGAGFNAQQFSDLVAVDAIGTHWLLTLTPLADPQVVVFGFATASAGGRPFDTIKASHPSYPVVFNLWFEQATGRLAKIEYANMEAGAPVSKVIALGEYKPFGGLTLPTKINYTHNVTNAERWTVESWEFPDAIDDAVFAEPK
jgi:hypothetical protein